MIRSQWAMPLLHNLICAELRGKAIGEQDIHGHDTTAGEYTIAEARA